MRQMMRETQLEAISQRGLKTVLCACMCALLVIVTPPAFFGVRYSPAIEAMLNIVLGAIVLVTVPIGCALLVFAIRENPAAQRSWGMRLILVGISTFTISLAVLLVAQLVFGITPSTNVPIFDTLAIVALVGIAISLVGMLVALAEAVAAFVRRVRSAPGS
jgi:hypothetical protein